MRNVAAVILAAGGSARLGQPKQFLAFRGETLLRRAVRAATEAGCDPVLVVVSENVSVELEGAEAISNVEWRKGVGTSIRRGVERLAGSVEAVVLLTCDQPFVDAAVVRQLTEAHTKTGQPIVASSYANTIGVPALFARAQFEALLKLPDDAGAKRLIASRPDDVATISFEAGAIDIDTPDDFERLKENDG